MGYRVAICNLGCKVNYYEAMKMQEELVNRGFSIVEFDDSADIYIVNTCTVTNIADKKSRQMLNRARKRNPLAIVVAAGCYVKVAEEDIKKSMDIDLLVDNKGKENIVEVIEQELKLRGKVLMEVDKDEFCTAADSPAKEGHCRAFLKIQDGCDRYCSYCLIPFARGKVVSMETENILSLAEHMANKGFQELVLTGIHISSFGRGFDNEKTALADLIDRISDLEKIRRIRLGSLEQSIITEDFLQRVSDNPKFLPHFHLSLQSGSDSILKRMNRRYSTTEYYDKCELIREYFDSPAITTDIIVGFPQETDEEFYQTIEFVKKVRFFEAHIFPFSVRSGTRAASMSGQISNSLKKERSHQLSKLVKALRQEYIEGLTGKEEEILVEETINNAGEFYYTGHSKRYVPTYVKSENTNIDLTNHIIRGKIIRSMLDGIELSTKEE